jgi:molybdopterin-binding protein
MNANNRLCKRCAIIGLSGERRTHFSPCGTIVKGESPMKISARNVLKGTVKSVNHGAVNSEVVIALPGGAEIVSVITKSSAESLGLAAGHQVYAVIKASNVMIAAE